MPISRKKPTREISFKLKSESEGSLARGWLASNAPSSGERPTISKPMPPITSASNIPASTSNSSWSVRSSKRCSTGRTSGKPRASRAQGEGTWSPARLSTARAITSWSTRIPIAIRPWKARISRLASSTLVASTVLEKESAQASRKASRHPSPRA